jgi:hypothetical protein
MKRPSNGGGTSPTTRRTGHLLPSLDERLRDGLDQLWENTHLGPDDGLAGVAPIR